MSENQNSKFIIQSLSLYYGNKIAFKDVNITIPSGSVTGIIGPSGCGKSSFIQCLNRMHENINSVKIEGDIFFNGKNIFDSRIELSKLRKEIGIVFQEPTPLPLSIETNISLPLKEHGFDRVNERVEKALKDVGLWKEVKDQLRSPANNLSGGQKQRLCLARTIALEPEVILMDEPCSNLDPIATETIESLIHKLKGKYTIIIITHNLAQAKRLCDNVCTFWYNDFHQAGEMIESGTAHEIFDFPKNQVVKEYISGLKG